MDPAVINIQIVKDQFFLVLYRFVCWPSEYCQTLRLTFLNLQRYHLWDFQTKISNKACMYLLINNSFLLQGEESSNAQTVFAVCLQAEQVPATVQDYREKLLHLRKLRHDLVQPCLPKGPFHEVANALYSISNMKSFLKALFCAINMFVFDRFLFVILLQCCLSISDLSGMLLLICWCKCGALLECTVSVSFLIFCL